MSLILSGYIEPFSDCLIKSVCKIFDVKVTNTHCCSLVKNDPHALEACLYLVVVVKPLALKKRGLRFDPWLSSLSHENLSSGPSLFV